MSLCVSSSFSRRSPDSIANERAQLSHGIGYLLLGQPSVHSVLVEELA
jgi:hypothetical protein